MFKEITLSHWRQFDDVNIALHDRMTVLTGQNGTGKTTILNVLSRHFGWSLGMVSTPLPVSKRKSRKIFSDAWDVIYAETTPHPGAHEVGRIVYLNGHECRLMEPPHVDNAVYELTYQGQQSVTGLHIPAHRPAFSYRKIQNIPIDPKTSQQQYQQYQQLMLRFYASDSAQNPGTTLKESLIALGVFGFGNEAVAENPEYKHMFLEFQGVLSSLLPRNLGFQRLEIRMPDVVFVTNSGDFSLDAASGGIGALVGIAWQIFMYGQDKDGFVVTIDEPESHLHPSMQRELLPNLFKTFPNTQFVVATHSPFIVTSSSEAQVYALTYNEATRVSSSLLEAADLAGSANEVLREILGVPMTVPIWVEDAFSKVLNKYAGCQLTYDKLGELKADLVQNNLGAFLPDALSKVRGRNA